MTDNFIRNTEGLSLARGVNEVGWVYCYCFTSALYYLNSSTTRFPRVSQRILFWLHLLRKQRDALSSLLYEVGNTINKSDSAVLRESDVCVFYK